MCFLLHFWTFLLWIALLLLLVVGTRISTRLWWLYTQGHMELDGQKFVEPVS